MKTTKIKQEDLPTKKFIEEFHFGDGFEEWEIETPDGWKDLKSIGKTIKYEVWELELEDDFFLGCADKHIVVKKLKENVGMEVQIDTLTTDDFIMTKYGWKKVLSIKNTKKKENMYDIKVSSDDSLYYTNDIVSHNSLFLANLLTESIKAGNHSAYVSLEMKDTGIIKRLGSNLLNIKISEYDEVSKDSDKIKQLLKKFKLGGSNLVTPGELVVKEFPTSNASVLDLERYLLKVQEIRGFKFKTVFVDYINIMSNWRNPNTENTYMKIKQIAEDLRAMGQRHDWSIITATQTGRSGFDSTDLQYDDVSESSGLIHTVDLMFGIIQSPEMYADNKYILKVLANRNEGYKNTKKRFNVNYNYMKIFEDTNSDMWNDDEVFRG